MKALIFAVALAIALPLQAGNFVADDPAVVAKAEASRSALSLYWFGKTFPNWARACPITVKDGAASGFTSFAFHGGEVFGWRMQVAGRSSGDIIDGVIPHEVNHAVFATEFRRPLPRWLDEGAATYVETEAEHGRMRKGLADNIRAGHFITFRELFSESRDYPTDPIRLYLLYSEGFAVVSFLVDQWGPDRFVTFAKDCRADGSGASAIAALRTHYRLTPEELEQLWRERWDAAGSHGCLHHACKAPHSAFFDPSIAITDGAGNGVEIRSPIAGFVRPQVRTGTTRPASYVMIFAGSRCGPCIRQEHEVFPVLKAHGFSVGPTGSVFEVRIDDAAGAKVLNVSCYPTAILFCGGKERRRFEGYMSAAQLEAMLAECNGAGATDPVGPEPTPVRIETVDLRGLEQRIKALEDRPAIDAAQIRVDIETLDTRIGLIESRPEPEPVEPFDSKPIEAKLEELDKRTRSVETIALPVRIETSDGVLIREKEYTLTRGPDGRLRFAPVVLKFDEKLLRGE